MYPPITLKEDAMFNVKRTQVISYYYGFTREKVVELMSLTDHDSEPNQDLMAEYGGLTDDELCVALHAELELGSATATGVSRLVEAHRDVESDSYSVRM